MGLKELHGYLSSLRFPIFNPGIRDRGSPMYPYDDMAETKELSEPRYRLRVEKDILVEMSDGVRLALDIYRPDAEGAFPALLSMSPYTKELQVSGSRSPNNEAGDTEFFVKRGYCHVIVDVRGSGSSEGDYGVIDDKEIEDGVELVEWVAEQDWCDGNVGMMGISYFGMNQLLLAEKRPPHLKAIFPYDALADMYRDLVYHGGKFCLGFMAFWMGLVIRANPRFLKGGTALDAARDLFLQRKALDGPFFWERSSYQRLDTIDIPAYLGSDWFMIGLHLRGAFTIWEGIRSPKCMMIGGFGLPRRPWKRYREELLRWYDHWLKGMDTGVMDGPPIRIYIQGDGRWRGENEWPLARTNWQKLYLHPGGGKLDGLLDNRPHVGDEGDHRYFFSPLSIAGLLGLPKLVYRTPQLSRRVELTGPISLTLHAASTASDTTWVVKLLDEDERGGCSIVTRGWLKASHREIDLERSRPYRPWHPHTREQKLSHREVYEFQIEIWPTSMAFPAGHRIRLEIASMDSPVFDFPFFHLPNLLIGFNSIYHSNGYPSSMIVPVVDSEFAFGG